MPIRHTLISMGSAEESAFAKMCAEELDTNRQIAAMEDLITQKVEMIFLIPTDGTALGPAVLQANTAGVPVITVSRNVT